MQYLNEYHRQRHLLSKQMEKERSEKPPMSPQEWQEQVKLLTRRSQGREKAARGAGSKSLG
jgi:hypothetical protein